MRNQILQGDVLEILKTLLAESINCIITSPPYFGLRNYNLPPTHWPKVSYAPMVGLPEITIPPMSCCFGLEDAIEAYVGHMVLVWRGLWRALRRDGVGFLNLGDSYGSGNSGQMIRAHSGDFRNPIEANQSSTKSNPGKKPIKGMEKQLLGIPWRCAFALQADGWYLRSDVIWSKKNPMPESVTDRPTKAHEYLFLLAKSERYWWDQEAIREKATSSDRPQPTPEMKTIKPNNTDWLDNRYAPGASGYDVSPAGRNKRTVWELSSQPLKAAHFAVMPEALVEPCLLAGCPAQVCAECGEPWVRVVERETKSPPNRWGNSPIRHLNSADAGQGQTNLEKSNLGMVTETKTIAHTPTCQCNGHFEEQMIPDYYDWEETAEAKKKVVRVYVPDISLSAHVTRPGVVLDPFFGSGTVGVVAKKFKREWAGIELNPDYAEMARQRLDQTQPALFAR